MITKPCSGPRNFSAPRVGIPFTSWPASPDAAHLAMHSRGAAGFGLGFNASANARQGIVGQGRAQLWARDVFFFCGRGSATSTGSPPFIPPARMWGRFFPPSSFITYQSGTNRMAGTGSVKASGVRKRSARRHPHPHINSCFAQVAGQLRRPW